MCIRDSSGDAWSGLLSTGYFLPTILTTLGLIFYDAWQLSAVTEEAVSYTHLDVYKRQSKYNKKRAK